MGWPCPQVVIFRVLPFGHLWSDSQRCAPLALRAFQGFPKAPGWPETPEINPLNHPQQLVFLELCPEINPWWCPGSGTCRSLPCWSGPEIWGATPIFGPWGSRGIPWYPTLVPSLKGNFSPGRVIGVIYNKIQIQRYIICTDWCSPLRGVW